MNIRQHDSRFQVLPIKKIIDENESTKTFVFEYALGGKPAYRTCLPDLPTGPAYRTGRQAGRQAGRPGQFIMMWIPGVDEKPMSIAFDDGKEFWVTVCAVGPTSKALHDLKVGDKVGVRGPFGTYYKFKKGQHLVLVAGGYGSAPMYFVASKAVQLGCHVEFLMGARNKDLLLYGQKILGLGVNLRISTDDGSAGLKGYVTQILDQVLGHARQKTGAEKIDQVFTCGPEIMMKAVGEISEKYKVACYMSMEKHMKCGIGICGQCAIDDTGDLCCKKGPVMKWSYLKKLPEMGQYHRDAQGKKHYFFKPLAK